MESCFVVRWVSFPAGRRPIATGLPPRAASYGARLIQRDNIRQARPASFEMETAQEWL